LKNFKATNVKDYFRTNLKLKREGQRILRLTFLNLLRCPHCGSDLEIETVLKKQNQEIITGVVRCECSKFPILEGIIDFNAGALDCPIVDLIKEKRVKEATIRCLSGHYSADDQPKQANNSLFSHVLSIFLSELRKIREKKANSKVYMSHKNSSPFCSVLGNGLYETYLKQRFASETFWSLYSFVPLMKRKKGRILDLCCGLGHSSFVISNYVKPQQLCCADLSFRFLYLAKEYFAPKADFVCLNANSPLPFKNEAFSSVLTLDAFHAVTERMELAHEMQRILFPDGMLLILHLHNSLMENYGAGVVYSMTPKAWVELFRDGMLKIKAIPERKILEDFFFRDELDLAEEYSQDSLDSANAITIVATSDESVFETYENDRAEFLARKEYLIINPIYKIRERGNNLQLERLHDTDGFGDRLAFSEKYLPEKYEISKTLLEGRRVNISDPKKVEDLMTKFIVVNVPENYM
jgi:SAM-dependent methyltransferase